MEVQHVRPRPRVPPPAPRPRSASLLTLNCGMGRDSIAMLCLLKEGRLRVQDRVIEPSELDAVIFSDTGWEWPSTYALVPKVEDLCAELGVRFLVLRKPPEEVWRAYDRVPGCRDAPPWVKAAEGLSVEDKAACGGYHKRFPILDEYLVFEKLAVIKSASCTDNHKVTVIRRALNDLSLEKFNVGNASWSWAVRAGRRVPHRVIIGFAACEASRAIDPEKPYYEKPVYPLVEMGIVKNVRSGRKAVAAGVITGWTETETEILRRHGLDHVHKSGCVMCPYQGAGWYWVLSERHPDLFARVAEYEARAYAKNPHMLVIYDAKNPLTITENVLRWRDRNPNATHEEVLRKSYVRCSPGWGGTNDRD